VRNCEVPSRWLFEEDSRFDATTYAQEGYESLRILEQSRFRKVPLGSLVGRVYHPTENQARSNFKRIWVNAGEGPPFLTGKQLFFFRPDREKFLSRKMTKLHELMIPTGTILLSRSGTTGYPVLVGRWLSQFAVTDDAIRVFQGSAPIGFVYAFLASTIGRPLLVKSEYGSTVSHLEAKHVYKVPVPLISEVDQKSIDAGVLRAYALRDRANDLLDEADKRLHEFLGVSTFSERDIAYFGDEDDPRAFTVSSTALMNRLDATHQVPVVGSVLHKLKKGNFRLLPLGKKAKVYLPPRTGRVYVEPDYGVPFLQGSELPMFRPLQLEHISRTKTKDLGKWLLHAGWVLITRSGTIGRTAVVTQAQDGWAGSEHMIRVKPDAAVMHPGFLAAFLATPFGQHQLKAKIYGGVVDELTEPDTAAILVPDIPAATPEFDEQTEIGKLVVSAYEMRDEANMVEAGAINFLEELIRKGANSS